jgi:hypothetical protein
MRRAFCPGTDLSEPRHGDPVAIYARASTADQSTQMQVSVLRDYVERRNWNLLSEYVDPLVKLLPPPKHEQLRLPGLDEHRLAPGSDASWTVRGPLLSPVSTDKA